MPEDAKCIDAAAELFCPECGYDLRGIASDRCPECGFAIDRATLRASRIPWENRKAIGRLRAYWRTNLIVLFRPHMLADAMQRAVDYRSAQIFRHVTILLAAIPTIGWLITGYVHRCRPQDLREEPGGVLEVACVVVAVVSCWLFLLGVSGTASYFFHPRRLLVVQQNRAIARSYYACAPLAWLWLPAALWAAGWGILRQSDGSDDLARRMAVPLITAGAFVILAIVVVYSLRSIQLLRATTRCGAGRVILFSFYLPISWLIVFSLCGGLVVVAVFGSIVFLSF